MITTGTSAGTKTVLYLHFFKNPAMHRRFLDGMRRFAQTAGWIVEPVRIDGLSPGSLRELAGRPDVAGCVRGVSDRGPGRLDRFLRALRGLPLVVVEPRDVKSVRCAGAVLCDNAAIAKAAFRELSADHPPAFAAVSYWDPGQRWARERIAAFRALCAGAGCQCRVFPQPRAEAPEARMARLEEWAAALPERVAIFAVNDFTAVETATALKARRRHVPKSATLVGVDGSPERRDIPLSPVPVTSVNVDFESAGFAAARVLSEAVAAGADASRTGPRIARFGPLMVLRRESTRGRGRRAPYVLEAVETIRREACDGLTAAALAARVPGSRKHFERRFREAMGHSVLDEILHARLERVQACLMRRDVATGAIAGLSGFGSEIELRRLFRRRFGMSMTEWRSRHVH